VSSGSGSAAKATLSVLDALSANAGVPSISAVLAASAAIPVKRFLDTV